MTKNIAIKTVDLHKSFYVGGVETPVLRGVNLEIEAGKLTLIFGPSGCGKTTLLNVMIGLEPPTKGKVIVRGEDIYQLPEDERALFRARRFGMVYQLPYWVRSLSVIENVALPLLIMGEHENYAFARARNVLEEVGMADFAHYRPTSLSGGQQQRVGLARALVASPWIIFADEPTGNLDWETGLEIMKLLLTLARRHKRTVVLVTHNQDYLSLADRVVYMIDGQIKSKEEFEKLVGKPLAIRSRT